MKLDNEQDRQLLLGLINQSTIPGAAVKVIAGLVQRIESAEIEPSPTTGTKEDAISSGAK